MKQKTGHLDKTTFCKDDEKVVLQINNLSKIFISAGERFAALKNINFSIKKGEFVSITGPSGSGKSTLLNMIGALDRPTRGNVLIDGVDIFSQSNSQIATIRNKMIGFIFQSFNLINRSSVQNNIALPAIIVGMKKSDRDGRIQKTLKMLGILDKAKQKPFNLSGGQQQRVAIARALINNPAIILADEPTGNLDSKTGEDIFTLLRSLSSKLNRTIVMVTHNDELAERTDRTIYIKDGRIEHDAIH